MSLYAIQSKTDDGSPLPRFIHDIMDYIAGYAHLTEWLFRKNGKYIFTIYNCKNFTQFTILFTLLLYIYITGVKGRIEEIKVF